MPALMDLSMLHVPTCSLRPLCAALAILVASLPSITQAQQVACMVNGDPITALDVDQRIQFTKISSQKVQSRQEALGELRDEKLKLHVAKRYVIDITDKEVNNTFNGMARRAGSTSQQFADALAKAGISVEALKARIKADIGWSHIIRGKFGASLQVGEKDVLSALEQRKKDDKPDVAYDYTLRQILFIVPRGSPPNVAEARRHEAEALRARFNSCDEGVALARTLKDVAVQNPLRRSSADLGPTQRAVLDGTPLGHLTPAEITLQGVE